MFTRRSFVRSLAAGLFSAALPLSVSAQGKDPSRLRVALLPDENAATIEQVRRGAVECQTVFRICLFPEIAKTSMETVWIE